MDKYQLLIKTLDAIISEAQELGPQISTKFQTTTDELVNQSRSRALIHLFLRTRFGLIDLTIAEAYVTDGDGDGGLDAYYIDEASKTIYLVQSKFRTNPRNFEEVRVDGYELFKMHLGEITSGESTDASGVRFNGKVQGLQRKIGNITNIGQFRYVLIFLGNIPGNLDPANLNTVSGNVCERVEIVNGKDTYNRLLLPYVQSNFYDKENFILEIQVSPGQSNRINYSVEINDQHININMAFIPTLEVANMMNQYKNSLLKYNPRCYVGIRNGSVNSKIHNSISNTDSNEFSLLNNGITIICSDFQYTERNARQGVATLQVANPQIVNGGQTAVTLANILTSEDDSIFDNKEVLVKFISLNKEQSPDQIALIDKISEATNNQTPVALSDRKSNDSILIDLQNYLFENHGLLLERKKGEFFDAIAKGIVGKDDILLKDLALRLSFVAIGKVAEARNFSKEKLFKEYPIRTAMFDSLFALVQIYKLTEAQVQRSSDPDIKYRVSEYGYGLRYGKYSISYVVHKMSELDDRPIDELLNEVKQRWPGFEATAQNNMNNSDYFDDGFNYDNYYKGKTINSDLNEYFEFTTY